jgi:hypothetical protein
MFDLSILLRAVFEDDESWCTMSVDVVWEGLFLFGPNGKASPTFRHGPAYPFSRANIVTSFLQSQAVRAFVFCRMRSLLHHRHKDQQRSDRHDFSPERLMSFHRVTKHIPSRALQY